VKTTVFWDVMPYSPIEVSWLFRGPYNLHLQGWRVNQASNEWKVAFY
jgi:hypothetical protein